MQEKWFRGSPSYIHAKWSICFRMWWQTFRPQKASYIDRNSPQVQENKISISSARFMIDSNHVYWRTSLTFLVSKMALNTLESQPISSLIEKLWKVVMKCRNDMFLNLWALFPKIDISDVSTVLFVKHLSSQLIFSVAVWIYAIHAFDESFFPPFNHYFFDWEFVFFLFSLQPLIRKLISSLQLCSSVGTFWAPDLLKETIHSFSSIPIVLLFLQLLITKFTKFANISKKHFSVTASRSDWVHSRIWESHYYYYHFSSVERNWFFEAIFNIKL